jgi:hypothetical protein
MTDSDGELADELAGGAVGMIPVLGPIITPLASRFSRRLREEWARNSSTALSAAEQASGMTREELGDHIAENPALIPLTIRVLYSAGMTGQDTILRALGTTLGNAVSHPDQIDEAELLLIGMADLRKSHMDVLEIMTERPLNPKDPSSVVYWSARSIAENSSYSLDIVTMCLSGLLRGGLITAVDDAYGVCYEISDLGRTALDVRSKFHEEAG